MAKIKWNIENIEVAYSELEATYTGVTVGSNGKEYRDTAKYLMYQAMLDSFKDQNMQQWQGFIDAVNQLTAVTDWVVDVESPLVLYKIPNQDSESLYPYIYGISSDFQAFDPNETCRLQHEANGSGTSWVGDIYYDPTPYPPNDPYGKCRGTKWHTGWTVSRKDNPNYDPNNPNNFIEKILPFSEIINQIVLNTSSEDEAISLMAEAYMDEVARVFITPVFDDSVVPTGVPDYVCSISEDFLNYQQAARDKYTYLFDTPEFDALMQTIIEHRSQRQCEYLNIREKLLDIDTSYGEALDVIGKYIGQPRALVNYIVDPYFGFRGAMNAEAFNIGYWYTLNAASKGSIKVLDDVTYRDVLKARIIKNNSSNGRADLVKVLKLLGAKNFKLIYNRHGVISIRLSNRDDVHGLVAYYVSRYTEDNSILPRQLGYRIGISVEKEVYMTSLIYPVYTVEGFNSMPVIESVTFSGVKNTEESFSSAFGMESVQFRTPTNEGNMNDAYSSAFGMESVNITKQVVYLTYESPYEKFNSNFGMESVMITKEVRYLSTTAPTEVYQSIFGMESVQITN